MSVFHGPRRPNVFDTTVTIHSRRSNLNPRLLPTFDMHVNGAYYPNWRIYRDQPPSSLRLDIISHVFYAFAWLKPDGSLYLSDEWADSQIDVDGTKGCLRSFATLKQRYTHLKVIISIGGGGKGSDNFKEVAHNPSLRNALAASARTLVDTYGLDGIDVDWEHPSNPQEGADYVQLVAALRRALPTPRYVLSTALPAGEWALKNIDLRQAALFLDLINLMTYDYTGTWTEKTGHHAQLYSTPDSDGICSHSAVDYLINHGVPSQKIILGIPVYGRSFLGAHSHGQSYSGVGGEEGTFEYKDLPRPGTSEVVDEAAGAAYCSGGDGGFVTYDNPRTVQMKAQYAKSRSLGGLFYWTATGDAQDDRSLIYTGYCALHF